MSPAAPVGKEKRTVSTTAVGLSAVTDGAQSALISVEGGAIRYWSDGSTPDASTGIPVEAGDQFALNTKLAQFLAIRRDAADATLQVQYFDANLEPGLVATGAGTFTLLGSDIEIGAVEIKDATTDTRAVVTVNGFLRVDLGSLIAGEDQVNNLLRVSAVGGLMPTGTVLNSYAVRITTNATTTPTASTAYVSSIVISTEAAGTTSTVKIQDKGVTPKVLVPALTTVGISTAPTTLDFQTPLLMTNGIDIVTAGAAAATIDVWVNYYQ